MNVWSRIGDIFSGRGEALIDALRGVGRAMWGSERDRRAVAFTIALVALSAKMAKADGVVTTDEVQAFRDVFEVPAHEEKNVARLFDLARRDVAGFDSYARQIADIYGSGTIALEDVLDSLFHIAKADGLIHERELAFLREVGTIFGFDEREFERLRARHVEAPDAQSAYAVLGAETDWSDEELKSRYRELIFAHHPDRLLARGVPKECLRIATDRIGAINAAWGTIKAERAIS